MDPAEIAPDPASPRAAAEYLLRLRPLTATATAARRAWVRAFRELADDVRREAPLVRRRAGMASRGRLGIFKQLRNQLDELAPPPSCQGCHLTLGRWFDRMIDSCEAAAAYAAGEDVARLHQAQAALASANEYARGFNADYTSLLAALHDIVAEAASTRLPVSRRLRSSPTL